MSELRVDTITDELGTGSPDFPNGITVSNATFGTIDITGSTIESTPIGQVTPAAGDFTTLSANSVNIDGGTIDGTAVNATTLTASGDVNFDSGTLFVDASENRVGIGTSSPERALHVEGAAVVKNTSGEALFKLQASSAEKSILELGDTDDANVGRVQYQHDDNAMLLYTNDLERMRLDSSGHAIIPSGVTLGTSAGVYNADNTLDDYEEGTWTPTVQTGTASYIYAHYTKVGRLVNCGAVIFDFSDRSSSNTIELALPFTSRSGARFKGAVVVRYMTNTENTTVVEVSDSVSLGTILAGSTGNYVLLKHSDLTDPSSQFQFEICYETDS